MILHLSMQHFRIYGAFWNKVSYPSNSLSQIQHFDKDVLHLA